MNYLINSLLLLVIATAFSSCHIDKSKPNFELIQDFMESPAIKSQEFEEGSPNNAGMRVPPEGTQPRGFEPYGGGDFDTAKALKNPFDNNFNEETLKTGIKYYTIHCQVCHGVQGEGGEKMAVGEKMALKPPSLISPKVKGLTDGQVYHIITKGQGVMGPYDSHIPQKYRWQVVQYVRHLEKGQ